MRPQWRLAINSLWQRPSRTLLLTAVVALSAALICAVSSAMASLNNSLKDRLYATVGHADLTVQPLAKGQHLSESWLRLVRDWPETKAASGRLRAPASLRVVVPRWNSKADGALEASGGFFRSAQVFLANAEAFSFDPRNDPSIRPLMVEEGRTPEAADEIVIDRSLLDRLRGIEPIEGRRSGVLTALTRLTGPRVGEADLSKAAVGPQSVESAAEADELNRRYEPALGSVIEFIDTQGNGRELKIVGLLPPTVLGGRSQVFVLPQTLASLAEMQGKLSEIDVVVKEGVDAAKAAELRDAELGSQVLIRTTAKITSDAELNIEHNRVGLIVGSVMAFLSAAFIIMTGMTTGVAERQRELAVLRCIGASRWQIGSSQLMYGLIIGLVGSALGTPLGVGIASAVLWYFQSDFRVQVAFPWLGVLAATVGSIVAGLLGAAWPAWRAARMSPLKALTVRAEPPRNAGIVKAAAVGLAMIAVHLLIVQSVTDPRQLLIWYASLALPGMFIGYFILSVPITLLVVRVLGPMISAVMALPGPLLGRTVRATPYRHGFTAGAMMAGLAMMVAIWTQGGALLRDWLGKMEFPDAFVTGIALREHTTDTLRALPFVQGTSAISLFPVETDGFGIQGITKFKTTFIAFEPRDFFSIMNIEWVQGDQAAAIARLEEGQAVIVAREFLTAKNLGLGGTFTATANGVTKDFDIVGVVTSPGLEIVSGFFDLSDDYVNQAMHAVFGTRKDVARFFLNGSMPPIQMVQVKLDPNVPDETAMPRMREALAGTGVLDVGSGRQFRSLLLGIVERSLYITSGIAMMSMLVACFGVANLIVAGIEARKFEFGVLRAVGAGRGMICRLVLAEAVVIALAAGLVGTLMGIQGAFGGTRLHAVFVGIQLNLKPPVGPIAIGWGVVMLMTLGAAAPAVIALARKSPRELLAAVKG